MCEISLVECQYAGDGPGFEDIENDNDFQELLWKAGFAWAQPIGRTFVKGRDKYRTIWYCKRKHND
jgi:hypothetical protein